MSLSSGARLGPYEVLSPLGAGGMGEVYRARDTRLGRTVAIKILPEAVAGHPERVSRFEREARSASALTDPHVVSVFDVGHEGDAFYFVTEIVEGGSLREQLARSALPLRRALDLAGQIASGLAAAHEQGIVHRDLKPENVLLTKSGDAKISDFGLAKLTDQSSEPDSHLPTSDGLKTSEGIVLGTVSYMSPEQARGAALDFRSDQFAFGSVFYEMLSGRPAFHRPSAAETLSAIMRDEPPPLRFVEPGIPANVAWIVERCLAKEPGGRYASTRDLALELQLAADRLSDPESRLVSPSPAPRRRPAALPWILAAAGLAAAAAMGAAWLLSRRHADSPRPIVRFSVPPPSTAKFYSRFDSVGFALSPDGSRLAFLGDESAYARDVMPGGRPTMKIWLRTVSDLESRPMPGTEGASSIFWSPDGRSIAFTLDTRLKRIDLDAGASAPICEVPAGKQIAGTWGAGAILFGSTFDGTIFRVSADGSRQPEPVVRPDRAKGETRAIWPHFLPDGKSFLYVMVHKDGTARLILGSLDGAPPRDVGPIASRVEYADPGLLVFAHEGGLYAQRFDAKAARLAGPPVSLAPFVYYFYTSRWAGFTTSRTGTLAYQPSDNLTRLAWFDRSGRVLGEVGTEGAGETISLSVSPDGRSALFDRTRRDLGTYDVWMLDLARDIETRLTSDPNTEFDPVWLPDGKRFIYSAVRESLPQLVRRDLAGGSEETLLPPGTFQEAMDVTPDGKSLLFAQTGQFGFGLWMMPLSGGPGAAPSPLLVGKSQQEIGRVSPDGRWLAYLSTESGRQEAYVQSFGENPEKARVSAAGATLLRWSRDGGEIFYTTPDRKIFAAAVRTSPTLQVAEPTPLFSLPGEGWRAFDVTADGRFLAAVQRVTYGTSPLAMVVNWTEGFKN
jgi:eukaryotic-like serine/threonine-protein kinase